MNNNKNTSIVFALIHFRVYLLQWINHLFTDSRIMMTVITIIMESRSVLKTTQHNISAEHETLFQVTLQLGFFYSTIKIVMKPQDSYFRSQNI